MSDEVNKNPLPRVIKGTGFYTPMDLAPGESPAASVEPAAAPAPTPLPDAPAPAQTSEGNGNAENE